MYTYYFDAGEGCLFEMGKLYNNNEFYLHINLTYEATSLTV